MFRQFLVGGLFLLFVIGCAHPSEYIEATDTAYDIAPKADSNVERLCINYINQITKHTQELVDAGKMSSEEREKVLEIVKAQVIETRKQVLYLTSFIALAHQDAHSSTLEINNFVDLLKAANEAIPQVKKLVDHFKKGSSSNLENEGD